MSLFPSRPVASTVLEEDIDLPMQKNPGVPTWLSMYQNSTLLNQNNFTASEPVLPKSYNNNVERNVNTTYQLKQNHMPDVPAAPLPPPMSLPTFKPPYGTPYPTNGYSAYDGEVARLAGIPMATAGPSTPIGTPPALEDARNSKSVNIDKMSYQQELDKHFKEGYKQGRDISPSCGQSIHHALTCQVCKQAMFGNNKMLWLGIGFLGLIVLILLFLLFKQKSGKKILGKSGGGRRRPMLSP